MSLTDYSYDANYNITSKKYEYDTDLDGILDQSEIYTYTYDEYGNRNSVSHDADGDGQIESQAQITYNESGQVTSLAIDSDGDGTFEQIGNFDVSGFVTGQTFSFGGSAFVYNIYDKLMSASIDLNGDGTADYITEYEYSLFGEMLQESIDLNGDGTADEIYTYEYEAGNISPSRKTFDIDGDGELDKIITYEYFESGELSSISVDIDSDGIVDEVITYQNSNNIDNIIGTALDDTLTGTSSVTNGVGEIDVLTGGAGNDTFVLGTSAAAFYDDGQSLTNGDVDYAVITDFNPFEDTILLHGGESYYLDASPIATTSGVGVFIKNNTFGGQDELIAVLQDSNLAAGDITAFTAGFSTISVSR